MQTIKEINKNPEMRSHLSQTFSSLRSHLTTSKLKTILLVSLISFTSLLVRQTLQIQKSCNPIIHWSGNLPAECQIAIVTTNSRNPARQEEIQKQQPQTAKKTRQDKLESGVPKTSKSNTLDKANSPNSDLVGVGAGAAAGSLAAGVAVGAFSMTPPGAVILGICVLVGVWQTIKTVF